MTFGTQFERHFDYTVSTFEQELLDRYRAGRFKAFRVTVSTLVYVRGVPYLGKASVALRGGPHGTITLNVIIPSHTMHQFNSDNGLYRLEEVLYNRWRKLLESVQ